MVECEPATMTEDIYDATLILEPAENEPRMNGDLECPFCGELVFPDLSDEQINDAFDSPIAAPFDCPGSAASLEFHIEEVPSGETGLGITVVQP
mgnify:CR=1 FL=1